MNSISAVEYFSNGSLVRVTLQFEIEAAIIDKNFNRFILAYSSSLLQSPIVEKLGISKELPIAYDLLHSHTLLSQEKLD